LKVIEGTELPMPFGPFTQKNARGLYKKKFDRLWWAAVKQVDFCTPRKKRMEVAQLNQKQIYVDSSMKTMVIYS